MVVGGGSSKRSSMDAEGGTVVMVWVGGPQDEKRVSVCTR